MRYLNMLPVSGIVIWLSLLLLVLYAGEQLRPPAGPRLIYRSGREVVMGITAKVLVFLLLTLLLLHGLPPWNSPLLMALNLVLIIAVYAIGVWKPLWVSAWGSAAAALHVLLGAGFYLLFGMMIMDKWKSFFNLNMTDNYEVVFYAFQQEQVIAWAALIIMGILFFMFGTFYISLVLAMYAPKERTDVKVNIRLLNGETLTGLYLKRSRGKHVVAYTVPDDGGAARTFHISANKVVYIEDAG